MKTFQELLKDSNEGRFTFEPNELTEIHVDYAKMQITVETFRTKKQLTPTTTKTYHSLAGMFGKPTVESKFNEIIQSI